MDLRNAPFLIVEIGHYWEKAHHKRLIVFSAYKTVVAMTIDISCAMNFMCLLALKQFTVMTNYPYKPYISVIQLFNSNPKIEIKHFCCEK